MTDFFAYLKTKVRSKKWLCRFGFHAIIWSDRLTIVFKNNVFQTRQLAQLGTCGRCGKIKHQIVGPAPLRRDQHGEVVHYIPDETL